MQYSDVIAQLSLLPSTFLRPGNPFQFLLSAKTAALFRFTNAVDGLSNQVLNFFNAYGVWLDAWGKLWSISRNSGEIDASYLNRISATLLSGKTTPVAIELFVQLGFNIAVTVSENLSTATWSMSFPSPPSTAQYANITASLPYVRPAGVPMTAPSVGQGGTYLGTVNYLGAPRTTGAYLQTPQTSESTNQSAYTNSSTPLLPTTFLSDPTLNPNLG